MTPAAELHSFTLYPPPLLSLGAVVTVAGTRVAESVQYTEEMDELLLADDELFDVDPEYLPRRLLKDFSVYNSEVPPVQQPLECQSIDVQW